MSFLFTNFVTFVSMSFSNTFEKTQRNEIGRKSPSDLGDKTLANGTTYAILNESGVLFLPIPFSLSYGKFRYRRRWA